MKTRIELTLTKAMTFLNKIDKMKSLNKDFPIPTKGISARTVQLLLGITEVYLNEGIGESQGYFIKEFGWTGSAMSSHTGALLKFGFIRQADDERDVRRQSKRLVPTKGALKSIEDLLS